MEKYSRWADLTTGINPFVPHKQRFAGNIALKGVQFLSGTALALVRLPLVAVVGVVLAATTFVTAILSFVPLLGRLLKRLTEWLLCSLLLLLLGVFVSEEQANTRRLGLSAPGAKASGGSDRVRRRDVIVCNHTGFLEVLVLAKRYSPVFVFVPADGGSKGLVHTCGVLGALYRAFAAPVGSGNVKIEDVVKRASGPVVVFPEGARSNGKSVLRFVPVLQQLPLALDKSSPLRVHLIAFRYEFKNFSPSQSAGGGWRHYFWTSFHLYHSLKVTVLGAKSLSLTDSAKPGSTPSTTLTSAQTERFRSLLAAMLRTKTIDMGVDDFVSFNAYWAHVTSGGRKPAAEFTDRKAPHEHAQWTKK